MKAEGDGAALDYPALLAQRAACSPRSIIPDAAHCLVTGTGLTHLGSADTRDKMHKKISGDVESLSDSMKMFRMGLEGGKPQLPGPGVQPEWFYKGDGSSHRARRAPTCRCPTSRSTAARSRRSPASIWSIPDGKPWRLGFALGNEYSDHVTERQNYLYLAHSKLRACAIGPELRTGALPDKLEGESRIVRKGSVLWRKPFLSGEGNMSHTIANLEYHHFKYELFRRPGDLHVHFFGTATLSFGDGIRTEPGDVFEIEMAEFGAPLRNRLAPAATGFAYGGVGAL